MTQMYSGRTSEGARTAHGRMTNAGGLLMPESPLAVCALYVAAFITLIIAVQLRVDFIEPERRPLVRALSRGEVAPGIPRLDPDDALGNAAILRMQLAEVGTPGFDEHECHAAPRTFNILLDGALSSVRFGAR